jgi:FkbM family methyltransferase
MAWVDALSRAKGAALGTVRAVAHNLDRKRRKSKLNARRDANGRANGQFEWVLDQSVDLAEATDTGSLVDNEFFREEFLALNHLHKLGVNLRVNAEIILGEFDGIIFQIYGKDDFQVTLEVFILNEYRVISGRDKLVVDIGMNAGYTSLFFAKQPSVVEVHAYEPFAVPFRRAEGNFRLNLPFANKIHAHNYGLGSGDEEKVVLTREDHTIGTSIKGYDVGSPEKISIRNASRELVKLATKARAQGLDLIVKMDCEGSEFPIFEALEDSDVLSRISVMMIEWHKWWSTERSSADLIEPLVAKGFVVFDRTSNSNPHAGMLYAARGHVET